MMKTMCSNTTTSLGFLFLSVIFLTTSANRLIPELDSEDEYRQSLQQAAAADTFYGVGGARGDPLDGGVFDMQLATGHGLDVVPLSPPEKRHLCRAKYVYNPVSGRCQPSLSALRGQGR